MIQLSVPNIRKKIEEIRIQHLEDEDPDLTFLGELSDVPGQFAIHHSNDPRVKRYFNADNVSNETEARQNYERMLQFCSGHVYMIGVRARAQIITSLSLLIPLYDTTINHVFSSGIWGIESDSDEEHIKEIEKEELDRLRDILTSLGFTNKQIDNMPIKRDR